MQSLWMVVAALFYAFYAVFVKLSGAEGIGSWEILFFRSFFGLIIFYAVMHKNGISLSTPRPLDHLVRSLAGTASILCGIYSVSHLNIGLAMTLNYTAPLFLGAFVVARLTAKHMRINWGLILSLISGFFGVLVLLGPTISPSEYFAACIGLCAGLFTAVATGFVKRLGIFHEPEARIIIYLMIIGSVCGLAGVFVTGGFHPWTKAGALWILGLCVCSVGGQFFLTRAFSRGNMVLSGALQYTVILFSTILGEILFNEPANLIVITGMVIIVASGITASYFTRKEQKNTGALKKAPSSPK